jgi:hypothetical protein
MPGSGRLPRRRSRFRLPGFRRFHAFSDDFMTAGCIWRILTAPFAGGSIFQTFFPSRPIISGCFIRWSRSRWRLSRSRRRRLNPGVPSPVPSAPCFESVKRLRRLKNDAGADRFRSAPDVAQCSPQRLRTPCFGVCDRLPPGDRSNLGLSCPNPDMLRKVFSSPWWAVVFRWR